MIPQFLQHCAKQRSGEILTQIITPHQLRFALEFWLHLWNGPATLPREAEQSTPQHRRGCRLDLCPPNCLLACYLPLCRGTRNWNSFQRSRAMYCKEERRGAGNGVKCYNSKSGCCFKMFVMNTSEMFIKSLQSYLFEMQRTDLD